MLSSRQARRTGNRMGKNREPRVTDSVAAILHGATLTLLERTGVRVESERALDLHVVNRSWSAPQLGRRNC